MKIQVVPKLVTPPRSQENMLGSPHPTMSLPFVLMETDFTREPKGSSFLPPTYGIYLNTSFLQPLPSYSTWEVLLFVYPPSLWLQSPKLLPFPPQPIPSPLPRATL